MVPVMALWFWAGGGGLRVPLPAAAGGRPLGSEVKHERSWGGLSARWAAGIFTLVPGPWV